MGMPATPPLVTTIESLMALPADGWRHELLDGVHVVTPAPRQYWIVDPDARLVERWQPGDKRPEIVEEMLSFTLPGASGIIDVQAVFRRALGQATA